MEVVTALQARHWYQLEENPSNARGALHFGITKLQFCKLRSGALQEVEPGTPDEVAEPAPLPPSSRPQPVDTFFAETDALFDVPETTRPGQQPVCMACDANDPDGGYRPGDGEQPWLCNECLTLAVQPHPPVKTPGPVPLQLGLFGGRG